MLRQDDPSTSKTAEAAKTTKAPTASKTATAPRAPRTPPADLAQRVTPHQCSGRAPDQLFVLHLLCLLADGHRPKTPCHGPQAPCETAVWLGTLGLLIDRLTVRCAVGSLGGITVGRCAVRRRRVTLRWRGWWCIALRMSPKWGLLWVTILWRARSIATLGVTCLGITRLGVTRLGITSWSASRWWYLWHRKPTIIGRVRSRLSRGLSGVRAGGTRSARRRGPKSKTSLSLNIGRHGALRIWTVRWWGCCGQGWGSDFSHVFGVFCWVPRRLCRVRRLGRLSTSSSWWRRRSRLIERLHPGAVKQATQTCLVMGSNQTERLFVNRADFNLAMQGSYIAL